MSGMMNNNIPSKHTTDVPLTTANPTVGSTISTTTTTSTPTTDLNRNLINPSLDHPSANQVRANNPSYGMSGASLNNDEHGAINSSIHSATSGMNMMSIDEKAPINNNMSMNTSSKALTEPLLPHDSAISGPMIHHDSASAGMNNPSFNAHSGLTSSAGMSKPALDSSMTGTSLNKTSSSDLRNPSTDSDRALGNSSIHSSHSGLSASSMKQQPATMNSSIDSTSGQGLDQPLMNTSSASGMHGSSTGLNNSSLNSNHDMIDSSINNTSNGLNRSSMSHAPATGLTSSSLTTSSTKPINNSLLNTTAASTGMNQSSSTSGLNRVASNNSSLNTTAPYGASTNNMTARTGAAYTGQAATSGMTTQDQALYAERNHLSGDNAMTRSEEQLRVAKTAVTTGVAALDKTVSIEHVERAVPIQRERVIIEREPITCTNLPQAMNGPEISEGHYETILHEERVVAQKETVPVERIRLAKQVDTAIESVGADLRKEHIDFAMHENNKIDTTTSNHMTGHSGAMMNEKIDTQQRSGLTNESTPMRNSHINRTANTRNV